ncbi:MAG: hypothetical protein NTW56_10345 [Alphaproteobacteria bacterium]|nr:hypothetical protein [Alphaproteobacteria bacterium]
MMRYKAAMRLLRILTLLLLVASPAMAQRSGMYDVSGRNPDGSEYVGMLQLQQVGLSSFRISWTIAGNVIEGAGMVSGLMLGVVFQLGEQTGMGMYELRPNGELVGTWTILGSQATGQETLRPR